MLKKSIIGLYLGTAVFLMSFSSETNNSKNIDFQKQSRVEIMWDQLGNISKSLQVMSNYSNVIKESLHGREIKISGFIISVDAKSYVLSKNVFSHCFFCSTAGVETIMGIEFKGNPPPLNNGYFCYIGRNIFL